MDAYVWRQTTSSARRNLVSGMGLEVPERTRRVLDQLQPHRDPRATGYVLSNPIQDGLRLEVHY